MALNLNFVIVQLVHPAGRKVLVVEPSLVEEPVPDVVDGLLGEPAHLVHVGQGAPPRGEAGPLRVTEENCSSAIIIISPSRGQLGIFPDNKSDAF